MANGVARPTELLTLVRGTYYELQTGAGQTLPAWAYTAFYPIKILGRALEEFRRNHGLTRASGLAFVTLLELVPLSVVTFQVLRLSSVFAEKQQDALNWMFSFLVPAKTAEVQEFFLGTVGERTASLTPLALALIFLMCLLLLNTIEGTFNAVWGVQRARPLNRKIVAYWTVLTMPVLLVAMSHVFSVWAGNWLITTVGDERFSTLYAVSLRLLVMIPTWLGFSCAYLFVPYTTVRPRAALVGGILAGTIWEISKMGYLTYSRTMFSNIETLYGPLSTIPLTLIWIYVSWLVVIFGAEVTFALQYPESPVMAGNAHAAQRAFRAYFAVRVMAAIVRHYEEGTVARATSHALSADLDTPPDVMLPLLDDLRQGGLILLTEDEEWAPARPPHTISVQDVIAATGERQFGVPDGARDPVSRELRMHFGQVREKLRTHLASLPVTSLARDGGD